MLIERLRTMRQAISSLAVDAELLRRDIPDTAHPYEDEMARDLALSLRGWEKRFAARVNQLGGDIVLRPQLKVVSPVEPDPAPVTVPAELTGFVLVDEAPVATRARLAARWQELTHLLQMGLADSDIAHEHTLLSAHQAWLTS